MWVTAFVGIWYLDVVHLDLGVAGVAVLGVVVEAVGEAIILLRSARRYLQVPKHVAVSWSGLGMCRAC
jgi:hypothetical protein